MMAAATVMHVVGVYELDRHQPLVPWVGPILRVPPSARAGIKIPRFPWESGDPWLQCNIVLRDPGYVSRFLLDISPRMALPRVLILHNNESSLLWMNGYLKHAKFNIELFYCNIYRDRTESQYFECSIKEDAELCRINWAFSDLQLK